MQDYSNISHLNPEQFATMTLEEVEAKLRVGASMYRRAYIKKFGFAVPCIEMINYLTSAGRVLEVGCGTGTIASFCPNVKATDLLEQKEERWNWKHSNTEIEDIDGLAAYRKYKDEIDAVFLSWPYMDPENSWFNKLVDEMKPGHKLILIGEGHYGCTGNDQLFDQLEENFEECTYMRIPNWDGIHDAMTIHIKKA